MSEHKTGFSASCQNCGLQKVCFSIGLTKEGIDRLDGIVERQAPLKRISIFLWRATNSLLCMW
jgi:CRP/FNR family transcriptional regulator